MQIEKRAKTKRRILFFITEDWYFWIHWLSIARGARDAGFEVLIATRVYKHRELIEKEGFKLIPIGLIRRSKNILRELLSIFELAIIYRKERPDIAVHIAIKPIIYGSLVAKIAGVSCVVNTFAGLGFIFVNKGWKAAIFRRAVKFIYRLIFYSKNTYGIFQNPEDLKLFVDSRIIKKKRSFLILGVGVDTSKFISLPEPDIIPTVMLASRLLWNKGIGELVEATRLLHKKGIKCRVVLVGVPDPENPRSISEETLRDWNSEGVIEWWGHRKDMPKVLSEANVVVLPTYGEGLPTILTEAASCGRAIVTTDMPGCREIVRHKENGLLVPLRNPFALAEALKTLIEAPEMRKKMGSRGREIVEAEFSEIIIVNQTINLYQKLVNRHNN